MAWRMSLSELLVLSSFLPIKNFYGIEDPFVGLTPNELQTEIQNLKSDLDKKGLVTLSFDDTATVKPELENAILSCANCDRYVRLNKYIDGKNKNTYIVYCKQDNMVMFNYLDTEMVEITEINSEAGLSEIIDAFFLECSNEIDQNSQIIVNKDEWMNKLNHTADSDLSYELIKMGFDKKMAEVITLSKKQTGNIIWIDLADFLNKKMYGKFILNGSVVFQRKADDTDYLEFAWLDKAAIKKEIVGFITD